MAAVRVRPLPADLQKVAIEQLNEKPEQVTGDIETLRTWIEQQPHLRARTDERLLLAFLRGCKYSLEKTKSKIDKFYTLRTKFPEMFNHTALSEDRILEIIRMGIQFYLPTPLNDNGPRVGIFRMGACPADKFRVLDIVRVGQMLQEITLLNDDYAIVNGVVHVIDLANVTGAHLLQMTPSLAKRMNVWNEEAMPLRPKANHFVNTPIGFEPLFNMFKSLMSEKLQKRLFVHGNKMELLHQQIPVKYLPKEYGGENGSIEDIVKANEKLYFEYRNYFKEEINYGTDEVLRPGKPIDFDNIFGIEGSFRKLNVD